MNTTTIPSWYAPFTKEELFAYMVASYFSMEELHQAQQMMQQGASYEEATTYLANLGQNEFRRRPCCVTIPGGHVLAYPPDRPAGTLGSISFMLGEVVRAAFPPPSVMPAPSNPDSPDLQGSDYQLGLWEDAPIRAAISPSPAKGQGARTGRPMRVIYEERQFILRFGRKQEGWVAKGHGQELGVGYIVEPTRDGQGFLVSLIHLGSGYVMAWVIPQSAAVDHERIQEWVSACLHVADWKQKRQTILREQPTQSGKSKQRALTERLEALWWRQEATVLRQRVLFDQQEESSQGEKNHG